MVEHILVGLKPSLVDEVVLRITNPGRGKDLSFLINALLLFLKRLAYTWLDDVIIIASYRCNPNCI